MSITKELGKRATKGKLFERLFQKYMKHHKIECERGDKKDLREPDFNVLIKNLPIRIDPKVRNTPFFKAYDEIGIDADKCVTIDMEKFVSYQRWNRNVFIVFYVNYKEYFDTEGVYLISTDKIKEILEKDKRRIKDFHDHEKCTSKTRVYLSIDEMANISNLLDMKVINKYVMR